MAKNTTAESRLLKSLEKLKPASEKGNSKEGPSKLAILTAVMNFVGGVGRVLSLIDKCIQWLGGDL